MMYIWIKDIEFDDRPSVASDSKKISQVHNKSQCGEIVHYWWAERRDKICKMFERRKTVSSVLFLFLLSV